MGRGGGRRLCLPWRSKQWLLRFGYGYQGFRIINVSKPATPSELGLFPTTGIATSLAAVEGYVFVVETQQAQNVQLVDVSSPASPEAVAAYKLPNDAAYITVANGYAYLAAGWSGLMVFPAPHVVFHMYGYWMNAGQQLSAQVTPVSGDPDLYVGGTSGWLGASYNEGSAVEAVSVSVPSDGLYGVAVYGYSTSRYQLSVNRSLAQASLLGTQHVDAKAPAAPPLLFDAQHLPGQQRALPGVPSVHRVYLPLALR